MVTLSYSGGLQLAPAAGQHPETGVHQARKGSQHNREVQFLLNVGHFSTIMKKEPAWGSLDSSSAWNKTNGNSQHQPTSQPTGQSLWLGSRHTTSAKSYLAFPSKDGAFQDYPRTTPSQTDREDDVHPLSPPARVIMVSRWDAS